MLSIDDSQLHHWNKILGDTRGRSLTMQQRFSRDALRLYADRMVTSYESEVDITPYLSLYRFLSLHCPHFI